MKKIVVSLGGSLIVPENIDVQFLKNFKKLILEFNNKYDFAIYCGGGKLARDYQKAASKITKLSNKDKDWLGIYATILNAQMVRIIFKGYSADELIINPLKKIKSKKILIAAGWKPGWSTDLDAVLLARNTKADILINITNVDYLYDKDPKKFSDAKPIKKASFKEIKKIIAKKWKPGLNVPFDPVAIRQAEKSKIKIVIIGKNLGNLRNLLLQKKFKGTIIHP